MSWTDRIGRSSLRRSLALLAISALLFALMPAVAAFAQATDESRGTALVCPEGTETFPDVPADDDGDADDEENIHRDNINCAAGYGIVQGYADGTYGPADDITRGQMATYIVGLIEAATGVAMPAGGDAFSDDDDNVHEPNINKLAEQLIVLGSDESGTLYNPLGMVTRDQMATYIVNAIDYVDDGEVNASLPPDATIDHFDDDDDDDDTNDDNDNVHEPNINKLAEQGIVVGTADRTYSPRENVRRDQMATFVMQAADYLASEGLISDPPVLEFDVALSWINENDDDATTPGSDDDTAFRQGEEPATGTANLVVNEDTNCIAYTIDYSEVTGPFAAGPGAHLHVGAIDENGPVVVLFATGAELDADAIANGGDQIITGEACEDVETFDVSAVVDTPANYYVNVHSDAFPGGAIRGQLPDGGQDDIVLPTR